MILGSKRARVELTVLTLSLDCFMSVVARRDLGLPSSPVKLCPEPVLGPDICSFLLSLDLPARSFGACSGFLARLDSLTGLSDSEFVGILILFLNVSL